MAANIYIAYIGELPYRDNLNFAENIKSDVFNNIENAISFIKDELDWYDFEYGDDDFDKFICEIHHHIIGDPTNKYEEFVQCMGGVVIKINSNGEIYKYMTKKDFTCCWRPKDFDQPECMYDVGDIVDVFGEHGYEGQFVIEALPESFSNFIQKFNKDDQSTHHYEYGYQVIGHNPHYKYFENGKYSDDFDSIGFIDELQLSIPKEILQKEFFNGLSIYIKCVQNPNNIKDVSGVLKHHVFTLYDWYFVDPDIRSFKSAVNKLNEMIKKG